MNLYFESSGSGTPVILLHGMAASGRYWQGLLNLKPSGKFINIDLLGFGRSPKPRSVLYDYTNHAGSVLDTIEAAGVNEKFTIVAHSTGALIALRLAAQHPDKVARLILCGLPYYPDVATARADITQSKRLWRWAYYGPSSQALCTVWCSWLRPFTKQVAPFYLRHLPHDVAVDSLNHSWQSYSQTMKYIIEDQDVDTDFRAATVPIKLLYGQHDKSAEYLQQSGILNNKKNIELISFDKFTHQLPLEAPQVIADELSHFDK